MRRAGLLLGLVALAACRQGTAEPREAPAAVVVRCEGPKPMAVDDVVALRGRVQPPPGGDLPVASQVAGRIAQVTVHEGDALRAGDVIAVVDDANTRDAVRQADAALAQVRAAQDNAAVTLERTRALVARGIAARQELDDATAKADEAKANVAAAVAAADLAARALGRVAVKSSFAGVVTKVWRGPGALVDGTAATPVVQLAATSAVEFVADATGPDLARVKEGAAAHGSLGEGLAFDGVVVARARALDPATGLGTARIAVANVAAQVPIGSYGRVAIVVAHREGVRTLPVSALRGAVADGPQVAVCHAGKVVIRAVKSGWRGTDRFEVEGVGDDERVAVDHVLGLEDGTSVEEAR